MDEGFDRDELLPYFEFRCRNGGTWRNYWQYGQREIIERLSQAEIRIPRWVRIAEQDGRAVLTSRDSRQTVDAYATPADVVGWLTNTGRFRAQREGK